MTLQEMNEKGLISWDSSIDEDTRALVCAWFAYRTPATVGGAPVFLIRQLKQKYPYYMQLLRIDATSAHYDWLIEAYNEAKSYSEKNGENNTNSAKQGTAHNVNENTSRGDASHADNASGANYSERTTKGGTASKTTDETKATDKETNGGRTETMSRNAPQSASYELADLAEGNDTYLEIGGESITNYRYRMKFPYLKILNPTTTGDTVQTTGKLSVNSNSAESSQSGSTFTSESATDSNANSSSGYSSNSGYSSGASSTATSESDTATYLTSETAETKNVYSGRNTDIATLISRARDFIYTSNAWEWLAHQLDICFLSCYDTDIYD